MKFVIKCEAKFALRFDRYSRLRLKRQPTMTASTVLNKSSFFLRGPGKVINSLISKTYFTVKFVLQILHLRTFMVYVSCEFDLLRV